MISETIFRNVINHIDGKPVQEYKVYLSFLGTYAKKRKVDRQRLEIARFKSEEILSLSEESFFSLLKPLAIEKIKENKIKVAGEKVEISFYGESKENDSGMIIRTSDSNLILNAPRVIFTAKSLLEGV